MSKPIVYLDLDHTLFDTEQVLLLWQELAKQYRIDAQKCSDERGDFYIWDEHDVHCYDFSKQLRSYGISVHEAYGILERCELADGRLEMPYVNQLVAALRPIVDLRVLTYGTDDYQRLKARLCPSLTGIPIVTTLQQKGDYFRVTRELCWMVDDKPIGAELPKSVHFIQVALEGTTPDYTAPWPIFTSLRDVKEYLYEQCSMH